MPRNERNADFHGSFYFTYLYGVRAGMK